MSTQDDIIEIMLVDDHAMLREGLRSKFEKTDTFSVVAEADTIADMTNRLNFVKPKVLVLDVKLPDGNSMGCIPQLKEKYPDLKVIVLTMYDHTRYAEHALENKADAFVLKGEPFEELLNAIDAILKGNTYISAQMAPNMEDHGRKQGGFHLDRLSKREFEALGHLSSGLSLRDTAAQMGISEKSVSTYRARLMEKMKLTSNADLIRFAMEAGISE